MLRIVVTFLLLSLGACGMKGPLVLPPGPAPEPFLGNPKPPATPAKRPDVSTDGSPNSATPETLLPTKPE